MKLSFLFLGIFISLMSLANTDTIPANHSAIEYTGRIDFRNPLAPVFSYSGVSIRASFTGTSIGLMMSDDIGKNYYNVILDGKVLDPILVLQAKKIYTIAEGLENKNHEIEVFKRTEQEFGKTTFYGFVIDNGATLGEPLYGRTKLIEYIGNSITCGYGNEGKNGEQFGPTTENHYMTYAAITSRNFNARHLAVCRSGIGIYRNYGEPITGSENCMTNLYTRTFLYDENPKYNFAQRPDLVCIDLGTNDFSTTGGDSARYVSNFFRLIDTIQTKYAAPDILCLLGPMMSGSTLNKVRRYLTFIADSATKNGKGHVYFFEMSAQSGDLGLGIDYHPTVAQHKRNAQELTDYIKKIYGWIVDPMIANTSLINAKHLRLEFNTPVRDASGNFGGIKVFGNNIQLDQSKIYLDTINPNYLHIVFQENIAVGMSITISYEPGTIESTDGVPLKSISLSPVNNTLTETKAKSGSAKKDGASIIIETNKTLKNEVIPQEFVITSDGVALQIDSAEIKAKQIALFVSKKVRKEASVLISYNGQTVVGADEVPLIVFTNLTITNQSDYTDITQSVAQNIEVYPNPNDSGIFYYRLNQISTKEDARLEVFLTNGAKVQDQELTQPEGQVDLSHVDAKGVYLFKFSLGNLEMVQSIIRQ